VPAVHIDLPPSVLATLSEYLEAVSVRYDACMAHIEHNYTVDGVRAQIRLHYIRFDGNGRLKIEALAQALASHITYYCISSKRRPKTFRLDEANDLFTEARDYFRQSGTAGEPGELLLYFLLEAVLKVPQMVCKMELKTNRQDETKGADGIHLIYDAANDCLVVYLGEAKLIASYSQAMASVFDSIARFHANRQERHELKLVTKHFKAADPVLREEVSKYLDDQHPQGSCRIVHACLVGYDWDSYKELAGSKGAELIATFKDQYIRFFESRIKPKLDEHCAGFRDKSLEFEFFFLPFRSVQEFRDEFLRIIMGSAPS